jgi:hypothetical protein
MARCSCGEKKEGELCANRKAGVENGKEKMRGNKMGGSRWGAKEGGSAHVCENLRDGKMGIDRRQRHVS